MWCRDAAAVGVAGVALGDIHLRCTWQAWCSRTTCSHTTCSHTQLVITPRAHTQLVVTQLTLAWQVWHLWHWAGSGGALGFRCGAGTPRLLAWQAWHLETSIFVSRGRRGTWWHRLLLWRGRRRTYGTGLALVARLVLGVAPGRRGCWRGRRGTWKHPSSFHVAGVVLGDIDFYSGVAGVALMALVVARLVLGVAPGRRGCWRGRRGTWKHPSSFHVAGVVLGDIDFYSGVAGVALMALGWLWWRAWF